MTTQFARVYGALNATETTETKIGTITIPTQGVRKIVGVWGKIHQPTGTNGEVASGYIKLKFGTVAGTFQLPAQVVYGQGAVGAQADCKTQIIPVEIPVPSSETVDINAACDVALTGTATCEAGFVME